MDLDEILRKCHERGWSLYEVREQDNVLEAIRRGNVSRIDHGKSYYILPRVKDPASYFEIGRLFASKRKIEPPAIPYKGSTIPFFLLRIEDDVTIKNRANEHKISIDELNKSLDYLTISPTCTVH